VQELDRWLIINGRDPGLAWVGSHWSPRDQTASDLVTFADRITVEKYAQTVFREEL
jgi:hypothetical protein